MKDRPRRGTRATFDGMDGLMADEGRDNVIGLRFFIEARLGGTTSIDFTKEQPRQVAIKLAGALRRRAESPKGLGSVLTISRHMQHYRRFLEYLRKEHPKVDRISKLTGDMLTGFEQYLNDRAVPPVSRQMIIGSCVVGLREVAQDDPDSIRECLRDRITYASSYPFIQSKPRDAYSPNVARQLRKAARADIVTIFRRIDSKLDLDGDDELRIATQAVWDVIKRDGFIRYDHPLFRKLWIARRERGFNVGKLIDEVNGRFGLIASDLPPLMTAICLNCGMESEGCRWLTADCLRNPRDGKVEVHYKKNRNRSNPNQIKKVGDGGLTSVGGLIRAILKVTTPARERLGSTALWSYYNFGSLQSFARHQYDLIGNWTESHDLLDDDGSPLKLRLSRLRKTYKAALYRHAKGNLAVFAVGHSKAVAAKNYANIESLRPLHERTVADTFTDAVARCSPTVVTPIAEAHMRDRPIVSSTAVEGQELLEVIDGEHQVWLSSCRNFFDGPFAPKGSACGKPFWGCLECSNAVITASKLPAHISFLRFIEEQRPGMSTAEWTIKFGRAHERITQQIIPAFPAAIVEAARKESDQFDLYLPPEADQ